MSRGIVYIGGVSRHLMDQSVAIVADRIARSLQGNLKDKQQFSYLISIEKDAHQLAKDISLDIASIEVEMDDGWKQAIDVLEVKYLTRFTNRFSKLPPLARAFKALWIVIRTAIKSFKALWEDRFNKPQRQTAINPNDQIQAI
jgi:hypothetical protein